MSRMVPLYAKYFTRDEIAGMLAFYDTPLGRKAIATMPLLLQDGTKVGQQWAAELVPDVAAGGCVPAWVGEVDAPPPPQAATMMAAEAPSPSSRLEIANCAPPPKHTHPALHGTPVVPGRIR